ncbi:hypothetical protein RSAG8_13532, partial [Rhizoctonia solani AG-8 WAC10335]
MLHYCLASTLLTQHQITLGEVQQGAMFLEQVGTVFTDMNVHLVPSFHAATHLPDHICFYTFGYAEYCNNHRPEALCNIIFYGFGKAPKWGELQVHGKKSHYGYIHNQVPVLIQGIYETTVEVRGQEYKFLAVMVQHFIAPDEELAFLWNHWNDILGIDAWEYGQLAPLEAVPPTAFTRVFALSDLTMTYGHFWIMVAMIKTRPEDLFEAEELDIVEVNGGN